MADSRISARIGGSALAIAGCGIGALIVGGLFGEARGWATFAVALLFLLVHHLRHLHALGRWLEQGEAPEAPTAVGIWDELHALLHRSRREAGKREAELARALARWRDAARALPDGVVILEEDRIEWCNETARMHLDLDPARDAGTSITYLVRIPAFVTYLESGDYAKPVELRPGDGRVLSAQAVAYGESHRLVLTRDITRFERLETIRREFVANVSHEMRTPLTVITGFLETLKDGPIDEPTARRYYDLMSEQSTRMLRLVEDLLTLSALESSPPPPMEEPIDMSRLLERLGAEARALSGGRHKIEIEKQARWDLLGTEKEIQSAFGNLVSNAIRYTPEGGTVRLRWRPTDEGAAFDVEDSGIGISPEHIPRLTERFYRVDRGRSRETGGTGLGLAIVKHALGRHGAMLEVDSELGRGSRFTARFTGPRLRPVRADARTYPPRHGGDLCRRHNRLRMDAAISPSKRMPALDLEDDDGGDRPSLRFRSIFISDVHLGTPGCQAGHLLDFLRHTESDDLYLVGDIIDGWQMQRRWYWHQSHNDVIQKVLRKARKGTRVTYVAGNHDEAMRQFLGLAFGGIDICDEAVHQTADGRLLLVTHGDLFDAVVQGAKWLALVGDWLYMLSLKLNRWFNHARAKLGLPYWSLAQFLKHRVKNAVSYITNFEEALAQEARRRGFDGVVCGHIHKAEIRDIDGVLYCNDGDWVESLTALVELESGELRIIDWKAIEALQRGALTLKGGELAYSPGD